VSLNQGAHGRESIPKEEIVAVQQLRPYQVRAVGECTYALTHDEDRTCLVAPPGAGKTRCAFHIAAMLGRPVNVRVPTRALVLQWKTRATFYLSRLPGAENLKIEVSTYASKDTFSPAALVILDEAHHLVANWGKEILASLKPGHKVLGLTATPPYDKTGWDVFTELVGDAPVEIETPPLVRDRHLAPYIDLVWPVLARPDEASELWEAHENLRRLEHEHRPALQKWVGQQLEEDLEQMTEDRFSGESRVLVSLCRFQHSQGLEFPLDLPADPEFYADMTLEDRALVLWHFGHDQPKIRAAIRKTGFRALKKGLVLFEDVAFRSLASSHSRVRGCIEILKEEARGRVDDLRALVLTDRDQEGDRLSARQILKALAADEATDKLDPILVTGSVFWVDDDLWPKISSQFPALPWVAGDKHHEINVSQWPSDERVALATRFLTEGTTRCLVGTRHLLGEGWDCPAVNCVIDLTGISASITVNQIRGRALRCDPQDPAKVASLWEVLALLPGISGGDRMLQRLSEKHEHTLGIDDAGRIRAGVGRIDEVLQMPLETVAAHVDQIRQRMQARVRDPWNTAKRWSLGKTYFDKKVWRVQTYHPEPLAPISSTVLKEMSVETATKTPSAFSLRRRAPGAWKSSFFCLAAGGGLGLLAGPWAPVAWIAATSLSGFMFARWLIGEPQYKSMLQALYQALVDAELIHGTLQNDDTQFWLDSSPQESLLFAQCAGELLGPVAYPRYLLFDAQDRVWSVPQMLGANKDMANKLVQTWQEYVGPCSIVFARRGAGRERLKAVWSEDRRENVGVLETWT
jgi:superfamily II DNA or RNA helicase